MIETEFYQDFDKSMSDLYESDQLIKDDEYSEFTRKWNNVTINVPATMLDYDAMMEIVESDAPELVGEPEYPVKFSMALFNEFGDKTHPLIDYMNMYRRRALRRELNAYIKLGYVEPSVDLEGNMVYVVPEVGMRLDRQARIRECLDANARFV